MWGTLWSLCNGHTFEHIYDYDIKLETTIALAVGQHGQSALKTMTV